MRAKRYVSIGLLLVVALASGVVGHFARTQSPLITAGFSFVLLAFGLVLSVPLWQALDEVSREAHKAAWCYGGQMGLAVAGVAFVWATVSGDNLRAPALTSLSPGSLFAAGIAVTFGLQVIGYVLYWAGWWLSKL